MQDPMKMNAHQKSDLRLSAMYPPWTFVIAEMTRTPVFPCPSTKPQICGGFDVLVKALACSLSSFNKSTYLLGIQSSRSEKVRYRFLLGGNFGVSCEDVYLLVQWIIFNDR
jgi:hypothetical protein